MTGHSGAAPRTDLVALASEKPIHFMGIGGAGMAPLADLFRHAGGQVTGCDARPGSAADALSRRGVTVSAGHSPGHVEGCAALVITSAIPADHPEIAAARAAGIPVIKRAEALAAVVNRGSVVGVAGTHGKTTTTALCTSVLAAAGLDPTGLVGGRVRLWDGNLRIGGESLFVVEADEYDRSFLTLDPTVAVVTTIEADHLDVFGTLDGVERAFLEYLERVRPGGHIVASADDAGVGRLLPRLRTPVPRVTTCGLSAGAILRAEDVVVAGHRTTFTVRESGRSHGRFALRVPGIHNVRNALAAIAVGRHFDAAWSVIADALEEYAGVERRFEEVGEAGGVIVIDDYAHHPTEIAATLDAARRRFPDRRLVAVFQPHLYSRTRDFATGFAQALAAADLVFVADVYPAREAPIEGVTGELIAAPARAAGVAAHYVPDRSALAASVAESLRPGDVCITLGAGDVNDAAREILSLLGDDAG